MKALEIPRGEVRPYGWIAAEIGRPKAVRAVGTALGHNPIPLIVPCHRVVRSDGMHRPVLARRAGATSGRSSPRRAPTRTGSRRWRGPASATSARTRRGSTACRPATTPGASPIATCPLPVGRARRTAPATGRASTAGRPRSRARPEPRPGPRALARGRARPRAVDLLHSANLGPTDYANGRAHDPPRRARWSGLAILILYVVWGSTYLGIRVAVESIPPFVMAAARFAARRPVMLGAVAIVRRGALVRPSLVELRDCVHRRRPADGRRDGRSSPGASRPSRPASPAS